ncbi:MAG: tyrosyl-tRNA synthetase [Candidatus Paceibacteria bacterium]|jgi:tyrosyl-tRNA synthetase
MKLSELLQARGFIHQFTADTLSEIVDKEKRVVYHGFDPSADSIHAGNFVQWMLLRHLANHGHKIVLLVGGATGRIGDPKPDSERPMVDEEEVNRRVEKMKVQAELLLGGTVELVNNYDWFKDIKFIDFLRDVGKFFTVNELIKKDAIATRLQSEVGLSYTEFAYPLVQGFDYLTLYRNKNCTLQTGGSDQWGNMVAGVDLVRRTEQASVHVVTTPIIVDKVTGRKFGKSEGNAVWLDPEKTTPYEFYQFWLNANDESAVDYLKLFTFLSLEEIASIAKDFEMNPGARAAQKKLAFEVTVLVHGAEVAKAVCEVSELLFGGGSVVGISGEAKEILIASAPTKEVSVGDSLVDVLVVSELATSKREARTFIESNAVSLQEEKSADVELQLQEENFSDGLALLRRGKKQLCVLIKK